MMTDFTITPAGAAVLHSPSPQLQTKAVKFDAAFLERRMAEHRRLVADAQRDYEETIIRKWIGRAQ